MATTTTTTTTTTDTGGVPLRNPKDSMKSTWRKDKSQWGYHHYMIELLGISHEDYGRKVPVHQKTDSMPYLPPLPNHLWVLAHALWPMAIQQAYIWYTGKNIHPIAAFVCYALAYKLNGIHLFRVLRNLGHKYGYLDGDKHERDGVPDHSVQKVFDSLVLTSTLRPMMSLMLAWDSSKAPLDFSWWIILESGLYAIILDFWFYWYHRCMHGFEGLWKYHRTHHLTKHPNPLLTLYADTEQEIFDIAVIPLLTYGTMKLMGLPMGFYDWWICHQYIVYIELWGHSGIRVYSTPPNTLAWVLSYFDAELAIEDHDLHHRKGWKKSHNYGKQTRLWDRVFNTCHERYETRPEQIDFEHPITLGLINGC